MKWFYNLKISTKLVGGFILVALIAAVIGLIGIINMQTISSSGDALYEENLLPMSPLNEVAVSFQRVRINLRDHILDPKNPDTYENTIKELDKDIEENLNEYEKGISSTDEQKELNNLRSVLAKYNEFQDECIKLSREDKDAEALILLQQNKQLAIDTDNYITNLFKLNVDQADIRAKDNTATANSSMILMISILAIGVLVAIALGIFISRIISKPVGKLVEAADKLALGDVDVNIEASTKDEIGTLMASFAKMVQNIRGQAEEANKIAAGDMSVEVKVKSDKDILSKSMKQVVDTLRSMISEMDNMSKQHDAGDIDIYVPEEKFQGAYRKMAQGVNGMVKGHISVKKKAMACIAEFGKGNFDAELERFPGKKAFINESIEAMRMNLKDVSTEINKLILASQEGRLNERGNAQAFKGDWAELVKGLNGLIDAIIEPVQEAAAVLDEMAKGNLKTGVKGNYKGDHAKIKNSLNDTISALSTYVDEISRTLNEMANGNLVVGINSDYRGDFVEIKNSLNQIIKSLNEVLNDINNSSHQVASGARQVSDSAQALSQGSTEQASSIEELTASIEEISSQTKQNAVNAGQANELALSAKSEAAHGNEQMQQMLKAMTEINDASGNISKIIKVIDEIAFQTNILALNAAVEAARAGQHGKGFAVVAEEVRNLAARSANAAKETTTLIEGSIKKVEYGTKIANETASALTKIVDVVAKAANIVGDIAVASNEQASGISQINQGIMQVSQVVQTNSATSEESAAASEELSSQAELLKEMVGKFSLKKGGGSLSNLDDLNPEVMSMLEDMSMKRKNSRKTEAFAEAPIPKTRKIALSDKEFGKY